MLDLLTGEVRKPGRMPRRNFMKVGFLGLGGLNLADFLRLKALGATKQTHTAETDDPAVILLWCNGGPSHLEMYDLKPKAPQEYRGPFSPINTNVPGLDGYNREILADGEEASGDRSLPQANYAAVDEECR